MDDQRPEIGASHQVEHGKLVICAGWERACSFRSNLAEEAAGNIWLLVLAEKDEMIVESE